MKRREIAMSVPADSTADAVAAMARKAEGNGDLRLAPDAMTARYWPEIAEIYSTLRRIVDGSGFPPIFIADGQAIGLYDFSEDACRRASAEVGVEIGPWMTWEEAGARLRDARTAPGGRS